MRRRDVISIAFAGAALGTSVLVVGGVLRWTQALVAALVAGALATQLFAVRRLERTSPLVALLGAAAALTALQLVPLPDAVLGWLDPTGLQLRDDGAALAGTSPWPALSLDPPATLAQLAFFVTLLGAALVALRIAASERGRFWLLAAVTIACGLAALVTGVHTLVNADSLYGLYVPRYAHGETVFGPLLNPNHLGGLMAVGTLLSLGLAFYHRQRTQLRVLWVITGLSCAGTCAASLSRGAMIGLMIGALVLGGALVAGRAATPKLRRHSLRGHLPMVLVIGIGLVVALYLSAGGVASQLDDTSLTELDRTSSKYEAWRSSITLLRESPVLGVGRGATEATLTRVHTASGRWTFSHLENEYLSAVVEWGIAGALGIALLVGWCITVAYRRRRDGPLAAAAFGALAAIGFQSTVDFGVELLGLAIPVVVIAATVLRVPLRPAARPGWARGLRAAMTAGLAVAAAVLVMPWTRSVREDHERLAALDAPALDDVRASIERHPLDYIGFGEAATVSWRDGDRDAIRYLNHALRLHPSHPGLHRLAARMLVQAGYKRQAALEYSIAMREEVAPRRMLEEILVVIPEAELAGLAIPTDYPNLRVMLHALDDLRRGDLAVRWLLRVVRRPRPKLDALDALYDLAMARKDYEAAEVAAELRWQEAHTTTSHLKLATVMFERKQYDALIRELADVEHWTGRIDEKGRAWFLLCEVYTARKDWNPALQCLRRLDASGTYVAGRTQIAKRLAQINEERTIEARLKAIEHVQRAIQQGSKRD